MKIRACTLCTHAHGAKRALTHFIAYECVYASCVHLGAWIFTKIVVVVHYYHMSLSSKFHRDPFVCSQDICIIILLFNPKLSLHFHKYSKYKPQKSSKMDNYIMVMTFLGDQTSNRPNDIKKCVPVLGYATIFKTQFSTITLQLLFEKAKLF